MILPLGSSSQYVGALARVGHIDRTAQHHGRRFGVSDRLERKSMALAAGGELDAENPPRLSPDGTRVAVFIAGPTTALKLASAETGKELGRVPLSAGLSPATSPVSVPTSSGWPRAWWSRKAAKDSNSRATS
jgi:hypothetical protein